MPKGWESHRDEIRSLYVEQGLTLEEVSQEMDTRHGFTASTRAYRTKLEQWGMKRRELYRPRVDAMDVDSSNMARYRVQLEHTSPSSAFSAAVNDASYTGESRQASRAPHFPNDAEGDWRPGLLHDNQDAENGQYCPVDPDLILDGPDHLHTAITDGNEERVRSLLSSGASASRIDHHGNQPLHLAVAKERLSIIQVLFRQGVDINASGFKKRTPLHMSIYSPPVMLVLTKRHALLSCQDQDGNTPLHLLLLLPDFWKSEKTRSNIYHLLSLGVDVNLPNKLGECPLHMMMFQILPFDSDFMGLFERFLKTGSDIKRPLPDGSSLFESFLCEALQKDQGSSNIDRCIKKFLMLGADPNTFVEEGIPLLHHYLSENTMLLPVDGEELLTQLCRTASPNLPGFDGSYPLHLLCANPVYYSRHKLESLKWIHINALLDRKADVNKRNGQGKTPLEILITTPQDGGKVLEYTSRLIQAGAITMTLTSSHRSLFELAEDRPLLPGKNLIKKLLEADMASPQELEKLPNYPPWAKKWREACEQPIWTFAKDSVRFEELSHPPSDTFRICAFELIAEKQLRKRKDQLLNGQGGYVGRDSVKQDREDYISILRDCDERDATINGSFYKYLLQIISF